MLVTLSVMGSVLSASSENWFVYWVGMEVSTVSLISIMASDPSFTMKVGAWKYFVFQCVGSALLFLPLILFQGSNLFPAFLISGVIGASLKLGLFPVHGWVVHVMENMDLTALYLLGSVQKIAPLVAMFNLSGEQSPFFLTFLLLSACWASLSCIGFGMTVKQILALSSILMSAWLGLSLLSWSISAWFFSVYSFHLLILLLSIKGFPFHGKVSALYQPSSGGSVGMKALALGAFVGLPPFGIFLMKVEVSGLVIQEAVYPALLMLVSSSLMLFAYMKMTIPLVLGKGCVGLWGPLDYLLFLSLFFPILLLL